MRYFKTSNASRQYRAGDLAVTFEPVENVGGNWSGLLAVEDDAAAKKIVAAQHPQITEIKQEEYEGLKKKPSNPSSSFQESRLPPPASMPPVRVAGGAVVSAPTPSSKKAEPAKVELKAAKLDVPDELKEVTPTPKPKPPAKPAPKPAPKPPVKSPVSRQKVAPKLSPKSHKK